MKEEDEEIKKIETNDSLVIPFYILISTTKKESDSSTLYSY
jgi:hypothetical protein